MALRDLLLKIAGDGDDAKRELADVAKKVAEFGEQEAEAIIAVDATRAETAIDRAKRELRDYGRISVEAAAGVEIAKGEAQIERIKARLDNLSRQEASVKVEAATTTALLQLDRVQAKVDKLKLAHAEVNVDVDRGSASLIDVIAASVSGLVSAMGSGGGGLAGATTRISAGFISFGAATGPLAAVIAALAVTIGVALVGALGALVASLAAAVAAVGVLSVALVAALGPVLAVVIAAVVRFAKVIQALRAQSAASQQAQQQAAAGAGAVTAAAEQQEAAARALTDANTRLGQATTQAYKEMADAAEAARDAVLDLAIAEDTRDQARLNTRKAVEDLADLRKELGATGQQFDTVFKKFTDVNVDVSGLKSALAAARGSSGGGPDGSEQIKLEQAILNVRKARNAEKVAIDGVSDAETNRTRTQQRANEFARQGINASQGYTAALRGVEDAQRQVNAAAQQQSLAAAQTKAKVLTDNLTDSERRLLTVVQQVVAAVKTALGPATDAVLGGVATALGNIATLATALKPVFTVIGVAIAKALTLFSGELVKPEWIAGLSLLAGAGAQLTGIFTADLLLPFLEILRNIAIAALPFLIDGLQEFGDLMKGLAADASVGALTPIFKVLVDNLVAWLRLIAAISRVMLAFFKDSEGPGRLLVDALTNGANALADWLNSKEGMAAVTAFFAATLPLAGSLAKLMLALVIAFLQFAQFSAPAVKVLVDILTFLIQHLREIALILLPLGVLFGSTFAIAAAAVLIVVGIIRTFPKIIDTLKRAVSSVGGAFKNAFDFAKAQVSTAISFIGNKLAAFANTAKRIGTSIGKAIVSGVNSGLSALKNVGKAIGNFVISAINKVFGLLNKIHIKVPKILGVGGGEIGFHIDPIKPLADGGITTGPTLAQIGEAGREAVLPLTRRVFSDIAAGIVAQMRLAGPNLAPRGFAFAGAPTGNVAGGAPGVHIDHVDVNVKAAGGGAPDGRHASVLIGRELARMG